MRPALITALLTALSTPTFADAPLGITGAEFRFGAVQQDTGDAMGSLGAIKSTDEFHPTLGFAAVNVAITQHHGLQGDALLEDGPDGAVGRLGGHLFMTPAPGQKYGIFATLADVDGEAVTYGSFGVEGLFDLGRSTTIEMRGGIGGATAKGLDFIFVGGRLSQTALKGAVTFYADVNIAEFEESDIDTIATDLTVGLDAKISRNLGSFVAVTRSRLSGMDAADEITLRAGLTVTFGDWGTGDAASKPLHTADPVAQLVRRGYF